jgi:hypothetical protein
VVDLDGSTVSSVSGCFPILQILREEAGGYLEKAQAANVARRERVQRRKMVLVGQERKRQLM